jgi:hypothetical protein
MIPNEDTIAEATFVFVTAVGRATDVAITIGRPYAKIDGTWACSVQFAGLHPVLPHIVAEDSLQALSLGLAFTRQICETFTGNRGRILYPGTDEDVPLSAYFPTSELE